jgi:hypothetical protein
MKFNYNRHIFYIDQANIEPALPSGVSRVAFSGGL